MANVTLKNVYKIYPGENAKDVTAVSDFNLEVKDREFVVFVGPSGCGKSTTLRMIAGLEEISRGDISIDGRRINDVAPKDRDIAMVFQNYALYPHMSVYENLAFGLKLRKFPVGEIKKRVAEAASILGIEAFLERKPKALSGGQRQRVALGRALVRQPKVFLFDEPLSNLDAKMRVQMRSEIMKLHRQLNATMIYVTHDQIEAMTMGDRIVVMKDGVVQQVDAPLRLYHEPANLFVAGFMGSPPMNILAGKIVRQDGAVLFKEKEGGTLQFSCTRPLAPDTAITVGIRPEDIQLVGEGKSAGNRFTAQIDLVEPMGAETNIYLRTGAHQIVCRAQDNPENLVPGANATFEINVSKVHFFDPQTSARLL